MYQIRHSISRLLRRSLVTLALAGVFSPLALGDSLCAPDALKSDIGIYGGQSIRHVRGDPLHPITFGLEVEVSIRENPKIVNDYRPANVREEEWKNTPFDKRVKTAREWEDRNLKIAHKILFEKMKDADPELPDKLESEGDGNFEFNGFVFKTQSDLKLFVERFVQRYGRGAMQAHVAYPQTPIKGTVGYVVFESDAAQFDTFDRNYARYLKDKTVTPAKNLVHHSQGPLGEADRLKFEYLEGQVALGASIGDPVASRVTNAPVFRGGSYPRGIVGHEIRQFHKRYEELLASTDQLSHELESKSGLERYHPFSSVSLIQGDLPEKRALEFNIAIDAGLWNAYFSKTEGLIKQYKNLMYGGAPVSQRFFFPLRDWSHYPLIEQLPAAEKTLFRARIKAATVLYLKEVNSIVKSGKLDADTIRHLQILNAKWGSETEVSQLFQKFRAQLKNPATPIRGPPLGPSRVFRNGKPYVHIKMNAELAKSLEYKELLKNSVEVIYRPIEPFGHIQLRVGKRLYGFEGVKWTKLLNFIPKTGTIGTQGVLFKIPEERMAAIRDYLEKFYKNSGTVNVPPFDAYSPMLEIKRSPTGRLKYISSTKDLDFANNAALNAKLMEIDGKTFLLTKDGFQYPVTHKDGRYYVQSLSCSTSTTCILKNKLGIDVDFDHGSKSLLNSLIDGNPKGTAPDAVIDYGP